MYVCLSVLYDCDIIRINSFRRYGRLQAGRRQALANRTCKSNLHGTSSYNSRRLRRSSPVHFRSSRSSRVHFRRATFRVSPLGPAAGLRKVRHRRCIHTQTHTYARSCRDCTFRIVPPPLEVPWLRAKLTPTCVPRELYANTFELVNGKLSPRCWHSKLWLIRWRNCASNYSLIKDQSYLQSYLDCVTSHR